MRQPEGMKFGTITWKGFRLTKTPKLLRIKNEASKAGKVLIPMYFTIQKFVLLISFESILIEIAVQCRIAKQGHAFWIFLLFIQLWNTSTFRDFMESHVKTRQVYRFASHSRAITTPVEAIDFTRYLLPLVLCFLPFHNLFEWMVEASLGQNMPRKGCSSQKNALSRKCTDEKLLVEIADLLHVLFSCQLSPWIICLMHQALSLWGFT